MTLPKDLQHRCTDSQLLDGNRLSLTLAAAIEELRRHDASASHRTNPRVMALLQDALVHAVGREEES